VSHLHGLYAVLPVAGCDCDACDDAKTAREVAEAKAAYVEHCNVDVDGCTGGWDDDAGEPGGPCSDCRAYQQEAEADARRGMGGHEWHLWNDRRIAEGGRQ
jgi:hypothetical protein